MSTSQEKKIPTQNFSGVEENFQEKAGAKEWTPEKKAGKGNHHHPSRKKR